jgi:hypothetical protein
VNLSLVKKHDRSNFKLDLLTHKVHIFLSTLGNSPTNR